MDKEKEINHRKSLFLAFLAYEGANQEFTKKQMDQTLANYHPWIGKLLTVWGPAYYRSKKPLQEDKVDSMAFVVRDLNKTKDFYIVIRGTNPLNLFEWIFQDFWVGNLVAWNKVPFQGMIPPEKPVGDTPAISFGTNIALTILLKNLKDPSSGTNLVAFLQEQAQKTDSTEEKSNFYLTGHSLGGVIASSLALFLMENLPVQITKPELFVFSYAGPTAGNKPFAVHFNHIMGQRCMRYANNLDVVTRVWNRDNMEKLPLLYQSEIQMPHLLLMVLYHIAIPAIFNKNYTQIDNYQEIPSKVADSFPDYIAQMVYQHVIPYFAELIRLCPESDYRLLLSFMESWEIFTAFKNAEPLVNVNHENLEFFLNLLK